MLTSAERHMMDQLWSCALQTLYLRSTRVACSLAHVHLI